MTKDFIDDLIEVVEVKKTVNKSSNEIKPSKAKQRVRGKTFVIAGIEIKSKKITSEETRRKISEGVKRAQTEEVRKKMSESAKGKILSEYQKRRISEALTGRKHTEEALKKMSEFQKNRVRKPMYEETKKKLSEAHKGKNKPPLSEETKRKMSEVRLGKKMPPRTEEHTRNAVAARIASLPSVMTPHGEFVTRKALIQKITSDGILNATDKLREWLKLYPNDYYIIKKPKKSRRIQAVTQVNDSNSSNQN
jgi:hypothetical protein